MDNGTESHGNEWDDWRQVNQDYLLHLILLVDLFLCL